MSLLGRASLWLPLFPIQIWKGNGTRTPFPPQITLDMFRRWDLQPRELAKSEPPLWSQNRFPLPAPSLKRWLRISSPQNRNNFPQAQAGYPLLPSTLIEWDNHLNKKKPRGPAGEPLFLHLGYFWERKNYLMFIASPARWKPKFSQALASWLGQAFEKKKKPPPMYLSGHNHFFPYWLQWLIEEKSQSSFPSLWSNFPPFFPKKKNEKKPFRSI